MEKECGGNGRSDRMSMAKRNFPNLVAHVRSAEGPVARYRLSGDGATRCGFSVEMTFRRLNVSPARRLKEAYLRQRNELTPSPSRPTINRYHHAARALWQLAI